MANILVVDDEVEVGTAIRRVLERAGHIVSVAHNATAGLNVVAQQAPDVVITDIIMPKVHGIAIIEAIRAKNPAARIIAISGGGNFGPLSYEPGAITTQAYLAAAVKAGADEVLTKPFDKADLLAAINRLLGH